MSKSLNSWRIMARPGSRYRMGLMVALASLSGLGVADEASAPRLEQVLVVGQNLEGRSSSVGKLDAPLTETPFSVTVLTQDFFTATGVKTIQDSLQYSAGVNGGAFGIDTRGDWSTIRGTSPTHLVDGLKSQFGSYNDIRPSTYSLERIEILKGPAGVSYGQSSIGGVINLTSKRPEEEFSGEIWAQLGNYDRKQLAADITGAIDSEGKWLFRVIGLKRDSETQTDYVDDNSTVFAPSLTWRPSDDTSITILTNFQENEAGTSTQFLPWAGTIYPGAFGQLDYGVFLSEPGWDRYDSEQDSATLIVEQVLADDWQFTGTVRYVDSHVDYRSMWPVFFNPSNPGQRLNVDGRTAPRDAYVSDARTKYWVGDLRINGRIETGIIEHRLAVGMDGLDVTTDNNRAYAYGGVIDVYDPEYGFDPGPIDVPDYASQNDKQYGLYVQDQMYIGNLIVSAGLRYDELQSSTAGGTGQNNDYDTTGRLGLMYMFDSGIHPYINYSETFQVVPGSNALGDRFEPREGEQTEVGIKYQPPGSNMLITAAAYEITEKNRLVTAPSDPRGQIQTGEVEIYGFELEAQATWEQVDLIASFSTTHTEDKATGYHIAAVPEELASIWTTYRFDGALQGFRVGVGARYIGDSWDGVDERTRKVGYYTLVDAMVGYEIENWFLSLNGRNLEDKQHLTSCLARGDCFVGERRVVTADVRYRF